MTQIDVTKELLGDLGELYFRHLCQQRAYGYLRLEDVYNTSPPKVLDFKFGFERIPVIVPDSISNELMRISKPALLNGTQSFVFDFLTSKVYDSDDAEEPNEREPDDFCWVEIKSGMSRLSRHQFQVAQTCNLRFAIFRITNVMSSPQHVEIEWEFDSWRHHA